jgi:hypothetical protein
VFIHDRKIRDALSDLELPGTVSCCCCSYIPGTVHVHVPGTVVTTSIILSG